MEKQLCRADCGTAALAIGAPEASATTLPSVGALLGRAFDLLFRWQERSRQRLQLLSLSDQSLKDVGLSRADIEQEAGKPFWRA